MATILALISKDRHMQDGPRLGMYDEYGGINESIMLRDAVVSQRFGKVFGVCGFSDGGPL